MVHFLLAAESFEAEDASGVAGLLSVFVGDGEAVGMDAADVVGPAEVAWRTFGEVGLAVEVFGEGWDSVLLLGGS